MNKFTQILVLITTACLVLAACGESSSGATPNMQDNSIHPTVGPAQSNDLAITSITIEKSATPTAGAAPGKTLAAAPGMNETLANPTTAGNEDKMLVINPSIKGQSASLSVGDVFEVQIPTIPTAGFEWQPKDLDTSILVQVGKPVYQADSSPTAAGGIVTLTFKAVGPGTTTLTLLYLRPALNGAPSLYKNSFGVAIEVK